jgi:acyl-coenzyme A synthetase/AMP-(fatty) acid ligase
MLIAFVRHYGQTEGDDALPSRRDGGVRLLAALDAPRFARHLFTGSPPLAFTFGLGGLLLFPLSIGAATLLVEKPAPEACSAARAHRVNVLVTAPTSYRPWRSMPPDTICPRENVGGRSAAGVHAAVVERRDRHRDIDGIGATECSTSSSRTTRRTRSRADRPADPGLRLA